jgi:Holliday junction resolvasome RuvABC endonuclease subunit
MAVLERTYRPQAAAAVDELLISADSHVKVSHEQVKANLAAPVLAVYEGVVEVIEQFRPAALAVEQLYAH